MADSLGVDTAALHASAGVVDSAAAALAAKTAEWETDSDIERY